MTGSGSRVPVNKAIKPFHSDEPASGQRCDTIETTESQAPADVRKLNGMGLTMSFKVGYELTALGKRVLMLLKRGTERNTK